LTHMREVHKIIGHKIDCDIYIYILEDSSVNLNFTLSKSGKVDHHIKMKIHKFIIFKILGQR